MTGVLVVIDSLAIMQKCEVFKYPGVHLINQFFRDPHGIAMHTRPVT
jgi:hypothetical protein